MNTQKIDVNVTQEDIDLGKPLDSDLCPIANALSRKINKPFGIGTCEIFVDSDKLSQLPLPINAINFIDKFDTGLKPEPFTFTLEMPTDWIKNET